MSGAAAVACWPPGACLQRAAGSDAASSASVQCPSWGTCLGLSHSSGSPGVAWCHCRKPEVGNTRPPVLGGSSYLHEQRRPEWDAKEFGEVMGFRAAGPGRASAHRVSREPSPRGSLESCSDGTGRAVLSGRRDRQTRRSGPYPASEGLPWGGCWCSQAPAEGAPVS